jgi:hypothetical protein
LRLERRGCLLCSLRTESGDILARVQHLGARRVGQCVGEEETLRLDFEMDELEAAVVVLRPPAA